VSTPKDPKATRFDRLSARLKAAMWLIGALAVLTLALPPERSDDVGAVLLGLLIAAPLLRVAWFVQRWFRRGDPRYALVGVGVLLVVAGGALLA